MKTSTLCWHYSLACAADGHAESHGDPLHTNEQWQRFTNGDTARVLDMLLRERLSEERLDRALSAVGSVESAASLLFQLDRRGVLNRHLSESGSLLVSCLPRRASASPAPGKLPEGKLTLSRFASASREEHALILENPGQWAVVTIHHRGLSGLLHDLSLGRSAQEIVAQFDGISPDAVHAILILLHWCGILANGEDIPWSAHEQMFHCRTRAGYTHHSPGRSAIAHPETNPETNPEANADSRLSSSLDSQAQDLEHSVEQRSKNPGRTMLLPPDGPPAEHGDPRLSTVLQQRRSIRQQGTTAMDASQLSEFLYRTVGTQRGRRAYPSGGSCYPINTYVGIRDCQGVASGLYLYEPVHHELVTIAQTGMSLDQLMTGAAGAADITIPPQVLLVFTYQAQRSHGRYTELGYSLALKEVGAIFQTAMLNATAMGLASCPLGCGNALLFADLSGMSPLTETSVGELMLGSLPESAA